MPEEIALLGRKTKLEKMRSIFLPEEIIFPRPQKPKVFAGLKNQRFFKVLQATKTEFSYALCLHALIFVDFQNYKYLKKIRF
ncbi:hypothetical protein [Methanobacterium sp.]|uniref:hypothetical protein n=1 Tax=Methanobacterium sp. TaxID=2164 RepID=UPI00315931E8